MIFRAKKYHVLCKSWPMMKWSEGRLMRRLNIITMISDDLHDLGMNWTVTQYQVTSVFSFILRFDFVLIYFPLEPKLIIKYLHMMLYRTNVSPLVTQSICIACCYLPYSLLYIILTRCQWNICKNNWQRTYIVKYI